MDSSESTPKVIKTYASKPRRCPACGHSPVATILYGTPAELPVLERKLEAGLIYFGGVRSLNGPAWRCSKCGQNVYPKTKKLDSDLNP